MNEGTIPLILKKIGLYLIIAGFLACASVIIGCTSAGLYSVNIRYDAAGADIPSYLKPDNKTSAVVIEVKEFTDTRKIEDKLVVGRVVESNGMKILVMPKYVKLTQAVSAGIKEYLTKAGYKVAVKIEPWDLKEESIPKGTGKIIIGGNIDELELICRKGFPSNSYKVVMKLTFIFADATKGKIFYKTTVESESSLEHVVFSEERMADQVNIALGGAIEKVFEDRKVAQMFKETITP
jgi:hypothetical protein